MASHKISDFFKVQFMLATSLAHQLNVMNVEWEETMIMILNAGRWTVLNLNWKKKQTKFRKIQEINKILNNFEF